MNGNADGSDVPQEQQYVAAVTYSTGFDDLQMYALDLLVGFISGNAVQRVCRERFDSDGVLIDRVRDRRSPPTDGRTTTFDTAHAPFDSAALSTIGDGFVRMLRGHFPVGVIVEHLQLSASRGAIESRLQSLLLGIHAAIEAWSRRFGRRTLVDPGVWNSLRDRLQRATMDTLVGAPADLAEAVRNKIASSNHTSTNFRERDLFGSLEIELENIDRDALATRSVLLHNGYFLRRFDELSPEEQQERFDFVARLTNLVI